jgi:leucyl/phenylalanyl-tRNA--protein transferase
MVKFIDKSDVFPNIDETNEDGILAVGTRLDSDILKIAYSKGIFPWYNDDEPVLWWSPPERMVIELDDYKRSPRLAKFYKNKNEVWHITRNTAFREVMQQCKDVDRPGQDGTWINPDIIDAYFDLYLQGLAWSLEVRNRQEELIGGLYGVDLGNGVFTGESMFSKESGASKFAFLFLIDWLKANGYLLLDCQVYNDHLALMGAYTISRDHFQSYIKR